MGTISSPELLVGHERLLAALADHAPVGVFVADAAGACMYANVRLCELSGLTNEQTLVDGWTRALHPEDLERVRTEWTDASTTGRDFQTEYRFQRPDGSVRWVDGSAVAVRDTEGLLLGWVGCCVDLTARKLSEQRYEDLFEHATDAIFTASSKGEITAINHAGETLTGYDRDQLVGMSIFDLIAPEDRERASKRFQSRLASDETSMAEYQMITKEGGRVFVEVASHLIDQDGQPAEIEAIARDTSDRHALEESLRREALHDPLTALPNRTLFYDRLAQALTRVARSESRVAVMMLDVDGFKLVNDRLGHIVGDELLVELGLRLKRELRASDSIARLGGDEFGLVFEDFASKQELVELAERLLTAVAEPVQIDHSELQITASLGIAISEPTDTAESALIHADTAMYSAKAAGKGCFQIYNDPPVSHRTHTFSFEGVEVEVFRSGSEWHLHAGGYEVDNPHLGTATRILFDPRHHGDTSALIEEILAWDAAAHPTEAA